MTLAQAIANLEQLKIDLPKIVGSEMVNFALDNIRAQSWEGNGYKPRNAKAKRNAGRKLLVDRGDGRRSIRYKVNGYRIKLIANDYMVAHNEGFSGTVTVKAHKRSVFDNVRVGTGTFSIKTKKERQRSTRVARVTRSGVSSFTRKMNLPERRFAGKSKTFDDRISGIVGRRIIKACT